MSIELYSLVAAIIFDLVLIIPVLILIWDKFKDDRILTRKIQEFYWDLENLIYIFYIEHLFSAYFNDKALDIIRNDHFKKINFLEIKKKLEHRHLYFREKVLKGINEWGKYLGLTSFESNTVGEILKDIRYYSDSTVILNSVGELFLLNNNPLVENYKKMIHFIEGEDINHYLQSLREYYKKWFYKWGFRPQLKKKFNTTQIVFDFHFKIRGSLYIILNETLRKKKRSKFTKAEYNRAFNFIFNTLNELNKVLDGMLLPNKFRKEYKDKEISIDIFDKVNLIIKRGKNLS